MIDTVLIVDDCETTATPLEVALSAMPHIQILMLASANDALRVLDGDTYHVVAVVTDLHLPLMNGFELIESIRRNARYSGLPLIVVTGDTNPSTRGLAFGKGANAYFPKPYSPSDIRQELERLLHAR